MIDATERAKRCVFAMSQADTPTHGEFMAAWNEGLIDFTLKGEQLCRELGHAKQQLPRAPTQFTKLIHRGSTSHHHVTVMATYNEIVAVLGEPHGSGDGDKVHFEWTFQNSAGRPVTLYDWKEGKYGGTRKIFWHVGAQGYLGDTQSIKDSVEFKEFLVSRLPKSETPR